MGKTYYEDVRARVLAAAQVGDNWRLVAAHNGVVVETARGWVRRARSSGDFTPSPDKRGGAHNRKLKAAHMEFLEESLEENCYLTPEQIKEMLFDRFNVSVSAETVRANLDALCYTVKRCIATTTTATPPTNMLKRQQFAVKLLQYVAADKKILYLDETNFNLWTSRSNGWSVQGTRAVDVNTCSKGSNIHVIACISRDGVEYTEGRFGSFKWEAANKFIRCLLRAQVAHGDLSNIVVVLDSAPCHNRAEVVFEEEEFAQVECLRLGLYSPMLNGIENVFSVYKSAVKRYMAVNRRNILDVPQDTTITAHRSTFLLHAANNIFREVVKSELCRKCIHHTFGCVADAILMKYMAVGS